MKPFVDSPITISGRKIIFRGVSIETPASFSSNNWVAIVPKLYAGWIAIVIVGLTRSIGSILSKQDSAKSVGTSMPRARAARINPMAIKLFAARTAVG